MDERGRDLIEEFCVRDASGAHAVQISAEGPDGLVADVAEFRFSIWGDAMTDGIWGWIEAHPDGAYRYRLQAMRKTGERHGRDEGWEVMAETRIG